jgi:uncharacterized protein YggU (UPF0235/DUF167 family)
MKFTVRVKAGASQEKVEKVSDTEYIVWTRALAEKGKANDAVVRLIAEYFRVPKSRAWIVAGHASRSKIIEVS